jgi:hypothetical protein
VGLQSFILLVILDSGGISISGNEPDRGVISCIKDISVFLILYQQENHNLEQNIDMKFSGIFALCTVIIGMSHCEGFHSTSSTLNTLFTPIPEVNISNNEYLSSGQTTSNISKEEINKKKPYINFRFMESFFKKTLSIFIKDIDTLKMVAKFFSWITWAYILLSAFGTFIYICMYVCTQVYVYPCKYRCAYLNTPIHKYLSIYL